MVLITPFSNFGQLNLLTLFRRFDLCFLISKRLSCHDCAMKCSPCAKSWFILWHFSFICANIMMLLSWDLLMRWSEGLKFPNPCPSNSVFFFRPCTFWHHPFIPRTTRCSCIPVSLSIWPWLKISRFVYCKSRIFVRTKYSYAGDVQPFVRMEFSYWRWPLQILWLAMLWTFSMHIIFVW